MRVGVKIEAAIIDALERYCVTAEDIEEAKIYFENVLVTELIELTLSDE